MSDELYCKLVCFFFGHFWGIWSTQGRGMDRPTFKLKECVRCGRVRPDY